MPSGVSGAGHGLHAEVHHAVAAAHDQGLDPVGDARRAPGRVPPRRRGRPGCARRSPASRSRGSARRGARAPLPLPGGRVGEEGELATWRSRAETSGLAAWLSADPQEAANRSGCGAHGLAPAAQHLTHRSAVNRVPGTARVRRSVERRPAGSARAATTWWLRSRHSSVSHRRRVGLVDAEQVARQASSRPHRSGQLPSTWCPAWTDPARRSRSPRRIPSQSGRSNGSSVRGSGGGVRDASSQGECRRRPTARCRPAGAAPVDHPRDDLGEPEEHQHRARPASASRTGRWTGSRPRRTRRCRG